MEHDSNSGLRPFTYDPAGNATRAGNLNPIVHDDRGRMFSITSAAGTTLTVLPLRDSSKRESVRRPTTALTAAISPTCASAPTATCD